MEAEGWTFKKRTTVRRMPTDTGKFVKGWSKWSGYDPSKMDDETKSWLTEHKDMFQKVLKSMAARGTKKKSALKKKRIGFVKKRTTALVPGLFEMAEAKAEEKKEPSEEKMKGSGPIGSLLGNIPIIGSLLGGLGNLIGLGFAKRKLQPSSHLSRRMKTLLRDNINKLIADVMKKHKITPGMRGSKRLFADIRRIVKQAIRESQTTGGLLEGLVRTRGGLIGSGPEDIANLNTIAPLLL